MVVQMQVFCHPPRVKAADHELDRGKAMTPANRKKGATKGQEKGTDYSGDELPDIKGIDIWLEFRRVGRVLESLAREDISVTGIGYSELAILEALAEYGPLPVNEIGRLVSLTSGSATAAVDRLEQKGYVERRPHATDRRVRLVAKTSEGRKLLRKGLQEHRKVIEDLVSVLSRDERHQLNSTLNVLSEQAEYLRQLRDEENQQKRRDGRKRK